MFLFKFIGIHVISSGFGKTPTAECQVKCSDLYILLVANTRILPTHKSIAYVYAERTALGNKKEHLAICGLVILNQTLSTFCADCLSYRLQWEDRRHPEYCAQDGKSLIQILLSKTKLKTVIHEWMTRRV